MLVIETNFLSMGGGCSRGDTFHILGFMVQGN